MTVKLAHDITKAMKMARVSGKLPWLRSDTKAQVTIKYKAVHGRVIPLRIAVVVVSAQHDQTLSVAELRSEIRRHILDLVLPQDLVDESTIYHVRTTRWCNRPSNSVSQIQPCGDVGIVPSGKFAGLTGRKIIVDTYGGWGGHGGGAFSGKDFRQVS